MLNSSRGYVSSECIQNGRRINVPADSNLYAAGGQEVRGPPRPQLSAAGVWFEVPLATRTTWIPDRLTLYLTLMIPTWFALFPLQAPHLCSILPRQRI